MPQSAAMSDRLRTLSRHSIGSPPVIPNSRIPRLTEGSPAPMRAISSSGRSTPSATQLRPQCRQCRLHRDVTDTASTLPKSAWMRRISSAARAAASGGSCTSDSDKAFPFSGSIHPKPREQFSSPAGRNVTARPAASFDRRTGPRATFSAFRRRKSRRVYS